MLHTQGEHAEVTYRGEFEGLWTDRVDVDSMIERRRRAGQLREGDVELLTHWLDNGYVILPGAVPLDVLQSGQFGSPVGVRTRRSAPPRTRPR